MAMSSKEYARLARLALPISISVTPTAYRPRRGSAQRADEGVDPDARDRRGLGWRQRVGHDVPGPRAEPDPSGRASCRERVCQYVYIPVVAVSLKKKIQKTRTER